MKRLTSFLVLLAIAAVLTWWGLSTRKESGSTFPDTVSNTTSSLIHSGPIQTSSLEHVSGAAEDRLSQLEQLGQIPEDADSRDWQWAQKASWWGKPVDPVEFWNGRVIWLDSSAERAAARRGRRFPPMPYEDPAVLELPGNDIVLSSGSVEMPNINFHANSRERAFWEHFMRTQPKPPEVIEVKLREVARRFLGAQRLTSIGQKDVQRLQSSIIQEALDLNYPKEALTDEALFWCYVSDQREEYDRLLAAGWQTNSIPVINLINHSAVDSTYITRPLTPQQRQAAVSWKTAYLQRLRRERVDESYINAYLKAWSLSASEAGIKP